MALVVWRMQWFKEEVKGPSTSVYVDLLVIAAVVSERALDSAGMRLSTRELSGSPAGLGLTKLGLRLTSSPPPSHSQSGPRTSLQIAS